MTLFDYLGRPIETSAKRIGFAAALATLDDSDGGSSAVGSEWIFPDHDGLENAGKSPKDISPSTVHKSR